MEASLAQKPNARVGTQLMEVSLGLGITKGACAQGLPIGWTWTIGGVRISA